MEGSNQLEAMRSIRKPMPPSTKVINPKDAQRKKKWTWRDEINGENENDDFEDTDY